MEDFALLGGIDTNTDENNVDAVIMSLHNIKVFIEWNNCLVDMLYPSQQSMWKKRDDCGSHSQHRWSIYDDNSKELIQLVVKHNSCEKALGQQVLCLHCKNKVHWRQPCLTPQNIFYILRVNGSAEECQKCIDSSILHCHDVLSDEIRVAYQLSKPRVAWESKVPNAAMRARLNKLEQDIERMVIENNKMRIETIKWKDLYFPFDDDLIIYDENKDKHDEDKHDEDKHKKRTWDNFAKFWLEAPSALEN